MEDKKSLIYDCAKELFSEKGFKDTNIAQITDKANIAVGTFYTYYPSKEKLFLDIFLEENTALKKACLQAIDRNQSPEKVVAQMLSLNAQGISTSPILKEWYNKKVFAKIEKLYREEHGLQTVDFLYDSFLGLVEQWQAQGSIRKDIDSRMIMLVFGAIINIDVHKEEIGVEYFPHLLLIMTELIMQGLKEQAV